jgi:putative two-component system response regulator
VAPSMWSRDAGSPGTEALTQRTAGLAERTALLEREQAALREATVRMAEALTFAMEAKDPHLHGHSHRVAALAAAIAEELGLDAETVECIRLAGRLHDVGKIGIRESVLNKPGPLTAEEYAHVQQHVAIGVEILSPFTHLGEVLTYVHHHHEHWDGSGYPQRLPGETISLGGRILCAADAYDAMTSTRPHRGAMSGEDAVRILGTARGRLLDPQVFTALERVVRQQQSLVFLDPVRQGVDPRPTVIDAQVP